MMEAVYLIFRIIRLLALLVIGIRHYMIERGKKYRKNSAIIISVVGILATLITLSFEINFSADSLLSIFVLAWYVIYLIVVLTSKTGNS